MKYFAKLMRVAVVLGVVLVYCGVGWLGLTEESRRSLFFAEHSETGDDYVIVNVRVTAIDPPQRLLHERIRMVPMGRFAIDKATPAVDLKLLINSVSGKQTIVYPKGERIAPVDVASPLSGNVNRYPFDRYTADLDLLMTASIPPPPPAPAPSRRRSSSRTIPAAPARSGAPMASTAAAPASPAVSPEPATAPSASATPALSAPATSSATARAPVMEETQEAVEGDQMITTLVVGPGDLYSSEAVSIHENFVASIAGVKFDGHASEGDTFKLMRTSLVMRRANSVIGVSMMVMAAMFILAISVMALALRVTTRPDEINLMPLSLCVALIFGLPALRDTQPGVPGVGALCDYLSFIWAEFIVSMSAIGLAWTWIVRSIQLQRRAK